MLQEQTNTHRLWKFDSTSELSEKTLAAQTPDNNYKDYGMSSWVGRKFVSLQDAVRCVNGTWPEGLATYEKMMDQLREHRLPMPQSLRRRAVWSEDDGDELNLDRLRSGQPYWRTSRRSHRPGPMTVTILTDMSTSSSVAHEKILWRGAASVCLTELLEAAGYRVELWAVNHVMNGHRDNMALLNATCLKQTSDPLDVSTLINTVSGWSFRTLFLASYHIATSRPAGGYGRPTRIGKREQEWITTDEKALVCEGVWSREDALSWVRTQLETKFDLQK